MKKTISLLLSVVMLLSVMVGADYSAYSKTISESESNSSLYNANRINIGDTIEGVGTRKDGKADYDFFSFDNSTPKKVFILFTSNDYEFYITMWNKNGERIKENAYSNDTGYVSFDSNYNQYRRKFSFVTDAGTNYIRVEVAGYSTTARYSFFTYAEGWNKIDGKWYYYDSEGNMVTGWQKIKSSGSQYSAWYYFASNGVMQTGWQKLKRNSNYYAWFYFDSSGKMVTGWQKLKKDSNYNAWYYFDSNGKMQTGWKKLKKNSQYNAWYYFLSNGKMVANTTKRIGNKTYRFDKYGRCQNP